MRAQPVDERLQEDLEDCRGDETVEKTDNRIIDVPKGTDAYLHEENDDDRDQAGEKSCEPDWHDLVAERVSKLRIHNVVIWGSRLGRTETALVEICRPTYVSQQS